METLALPIACTSPSYWWLVPAALFTLLAAVAAITYLRDDRADRRARAYRRALRNVVPIRRPGPRVELIAGDITTQDVGAIVNAAKRTLLGGGGVDGAIHRAGGPDILRECRELRATEYPDGLPTGEAVATTAGQMNARCVIHTVGPVYSRADAEEQAILLRRCYTESLAVADRLGLTTVAFPLISSGVYGWPVADAVYQALVALLGADTAVRLVRLVLFDAETLAIAREVAARNRLLG